MNPPKTIRTQSDDSRAQKHAVLPHNPKRHSASFRRVLVLVYGTVVLFALLITGIYTVVSPQIFASNKISDLIPKGQIIAGYIESTLLRRAFLHVSRARSSAAAPPNGRQPSGSSMRAAIRSSAPSRSRDGASAVCPPSSAAPCCRRYSPARLPRTWAAWRI